MKRNNKKGFTITELVIVIAVIAILAAVLIPTFSNVISNAKQSAALQTCSSAMKDYSAIAAQEGKSVGTGMVFVNDDFVFVYINGSLHYVGELEKLGKIDTGCKYTPVTPSAISGPEGDTTGKTLDIKVNGETDITVKKDGTDDPEHNEYVLFKSGDHEAENLYFYNVTINNIQWCGYFTLEGKTANYQTQGANYSRVFRATTQTGATPVISVEIHTEPANPEGTGTDE